MAEVFRDHPRKHVVRGRWNTPLLERLYNHWGAKYVYFGLPGPEALDVKLWKSMIARVIAFEMECPTGDARRNLTALTRQLHLLQVTDGIRSSVFSGAMEDVVLRGVDDDGKQLELDEVVTLYNLDFCNAITGLIPTRRGQQQLRFEALREIAAWQRDLFRVTRASRFVLLITAHDSFHARTAARFFAQPDLPAPLRHFVDQRLAGHPLPPRGLVTERTDLLRAFVFGFLRRCLAGQNISSTFLPPLAYVGRTENSPMLHFAVVCQMADEGDAAAAEMQSAEAFLDLKTLRATEREIVVDDGCPCGNRAVLDPVAFLHGLGLA